MQLAGFHHVTAITADTAENHRFYTTVLGLRLVKKTVNQDDVSAYHLYYADGAGTPGTDLTFFVWPLGPERRGGQSITRTGWRVRSEGSLAWWHDRFRTLKVRQSTVIEQDGRATLDFEDNEGLRLALVVDGKAGEGHPWVRSPVPVEHQLRGLGPITITVARFEPVAELLTKVLGMQRVRGYLAGDGGENIEVFAMGASGPEGELHVALDPHLDPAHNGAGGVHHLAFRAPGSTEFAAWLQRLAEHGIPSSGAVDRYFFRSLYFREPNGILFEIATDEPGFTVDEPLETMGERLALPPFLEERRAEITAKLKPLT